MAGLVHAAPLAVALVHRALAAKQSLVLQLCRRALAQQGAVRTIAAVHPHHPGLGPLVRAQALCPGPLHPVVLGALPLHLPPVVLRAGVLAFFQIIPNAAQLVHIGKISLLHQLHAGALGHHLAGVPVHQGVYPSASALHLIVLLDPWLPYQGSSAMRWHSQTAAVRGCFR